MDQSKDGSLVPIFPGLKGGKTNLNNLFIICHFNNLKLYLYDLS